MPKRKDKDIIQRILFLLSLTFVLSVIFRGWIFNLGIITYGDWVYRFEETMVNWVSLPYAWSSQINSTSIRPFGLANHPIRLLFGLLANLGSGFAVSERILYHLPVIFVSAFSMYYLTDLLFKNNTVSFFSALIFSLNSYVLMLGTHLTVRMAYSLTPLILVFYIKALRSKEMKYSFISATLFGIAMAYEVRISYIIMGILTIYTLLYLTSNGGFNIQKFKNIGIFLLVVLGFSAFWSIPLFFSGVIDVGSIVPSQPWISWMKLTDSLTLRHPFYSLTNQIQSFKVQPLNPIFFLIPLIAFSTLFFRKDKHVYKHKVFFALIAIVGIFLVKQENPPFGSVYTWVFKNFPGFNMFREASKFYLLIGLGYAPLFGLGVYGIANRIRHLNVSVKFSINRILFFLFIGVIFSLIIFMTKPVALTDNKSTMYKSYYPLKDIPQEYEDVKTFIKSQESPFRTLWLPRRSRFSFYSLKYPIVTPDQSEFFQSVLIQHPDIKKYETNHLGTLQGLFNVKYVVVAPDLPKWEERRGEVIYHGSGKNGVSQDKYLKFLDRQKDLEKIISGKNYAIYKNLAYNKDKFQIYSNEPIFVSKDRSSIFSFFRFNLSNSPVMFLNQYLAGPLVQSKSASYVLGHENPLNNPKFISSDHFRFISPRITDINNPSKDWTKKDINSFRDIIWKKFKIRNTQFDYGKGLVFTWISSRVPVALEITFEVEKTDDRALFVRYLKNQEGGAIRVCLDRKPITIETKDQLNKFLWKNLGNFRLAKGKHKIVLENLQGFNAVNLFSLMPVTQYEKAQKQVVDILQDKRVIYLFEAESDLYYENAKISKEFDASGSNAEVLKLNPKSKVWINIQNSKDGTYRAAIGFKGTVILRIDDKISRLTSNDLNLAYTQAFHLKTGHHRIEITSGGSSDLDVLWIYSIKKSDETIEDIFTIKEKPAEIIQYKEINPTKYVIRVNAMNHFMLSFAEAYHPLWAAYVNGKEYKPIALYSVINGFWIDKTGQLEIEIKYKPQIWFYYGSVISLMVLGMSIGYLVYGWRRKMKWPKR